MSKNGTIAGVELGSVGDLREPGSHSALFDPETISRSFSSIVAVVDVLDDDSTDLGPLHSSGESDDLDGIKREKDESNGTIHVSFSAGDHDIVFRSDRYMDVTSLETAAESSRNGSEAI